LEPEYREQLLEEMRLGDRAESVKPYLLPWLESSQAELLNRLSLPLGPEELRMLNATAVVLAHLKGSLLNDCAIGAAARREFRESEGVD